MKQLLKLTCVLFVILFYQTSEAGAQDRLRYLGSSCFAMPTAYVRNEGGYISDDNHSMGWFSYAVFGKFLEVSGLRHMQGDAKDSNIWNLKVNFLEEDQYLPNLAWGAADAREKLGSKIFYLAGSKTFETYGLTLHGGVIKDPITTEKRGYVAAEKMIMPLVTLAGERFDGKTVLGVKLRPYPGVSVEYAHREGKGITKQAVYRLIYVKGF